MVTLSIFAAVLSLFMGGDAFSAFTLRGTVIAVDGFRLTIALDPREPVLPAVGDKVDIIKTIAEGSVELDIGDWQVTAVEGRIVRAEPIMAVGINPPQVNMKAEIHLFTGSAPAGESPAPAQGKLLTYHDVLYASQRDNKPSPTARGKVIMTRGEMVTIRMDEKDRRAGIGDAVQLSYSVDGEVIPVGAWRVSAVKEDGTLEALPFEIKGKPNIGMDAVLSLSDQSGRPDALKKTKPSAEAKGSIADQKMTQTGNEGTSIKKEAQPKSLEETLASYSKTAVPISIAGSGKSLPCEIGTIRIHDGKIEMIASGQGKFTGYCMYRLSDVALESFYATVKVSVNTASNNDFSAAVIYGDQSGDTKKTGYVLADIRQMSNKSCSGLFGLFDCRTYFTALVSVSGIFTKGEGYSVKNGVLPDSGSNPTPGILAFLKNGDQFRVFWNGEEMGGWKEQAMVEWSPLACLCTDGEGGGSRHF